MQNENTLIKKDFLWLLIPVILLLPILTYPISVDVSIFLTGGRTIVEGGTIYKNFIDLKPPMIYYIYAVIYKLCGWGEHSVRIIDYLFQLSIVFSLYYVILKTISDRKIAIASVIIFSIFYISFPPVNTLEVEDMSLLPLIWALYFGLNGKNKLSFIYEGILYGIATSFKYTIGMVLIAALIHLFYRDKRRKELVSAILLLVSGFAIGMMVCHIPLFSGQVRSGYADVISWIAMYANVPKINFYFVKIFVKNIETFFSQRFSLFFTFSMILGVFLIFDNKTTQRQKSLFIYCWLMVFFLLVGIIIERKFLLYHYERLLVVAVILTSIGLLYIFEQLKKIVFIKGFTIKICIAGLICSALVLSPIIRWVWTLRVPYYYLNHKTYEYNHALDVEENKLSQCDLIDASHYIKEKMEPNDFVLILPIALHPIYLMADLPKYSCFANSCFIDNNPDKFPLWNEKLISEFRHATWLIFMKSENLKFFLDQKGSTLDFLKNNPPVYSIFTNEFTEVKQINDIVIYKRKDF